MSTKGFSVCLVLKGREVLLLLRRHTGVYDGRWSLPGGKAEENESPRATALRELKEEVGLDLGLGEMTFFSTVFVHEPSVELPGKYFSGWCFAFMIEGRAWEIQNREPHKHARAEFFPLDKLPNLMVPSARSVIQNYRTGCLYSECFGEQGPSVFSGSVEAWGKISPSK
ncbi:MAG: NUDIX domain-containing protein [Puniceicoccales bacterium]|nr:NUDIX domain-containing protein [Puniceicoccales bacterium]